MAKQQFKTVDEILSSLDPESAEIVQLLRHTILSADAEIAEQVKWNSPAYFFTGEMAGFDAKEYKRDIVVMNIRPGRILLVLPTGATIPDSTGFLEGDYTDGRRMVTIKSADDAQKKAENLHKVLKEWLNLVEK